MQNRAPRPGLIGAVLAYFGARRALVPFLASVGYVVAAGVRVDRRASGRAWSLGAVAFVCAYLAAGPGLPGNGLADDGRRKLGPLAVGLWSFAVVLASLTATGQDVVQDLYGGAFALAGAVVAARALDRIEGGHGIADSLPSPPRGQLAVTIALLVGCFGLALVASGQALRAPSLAPFDTLARDAHALASAAALLVLAGSAWETLRTKRLVLGAGDRAFTALGVLVASGLVAGGLLVLDVGAADRVLRLSVALASLLVTFVSLHADAEILSRRGRRAVALVLFGGPVVLLGGLAAEGPGRSAGALLVTGLVALFVGSAVKYLELPLRRGEGQLLDAVHVANEALVRADPDTSLRDALAALRSFAGLSAHTPELWSLSPPRVLVIDAAGYAHERDALLPPLLLAVAEEEPEATVRAELLDALVVRRPDLRPLARWMDERGALSATLVTREREVEGVILLPRGSRRVPMSLEEVRAIKRLADAFAGASAAHAALGRSLERERVATARADEAEARLLARERIDRAIAERERIATTRLAEVAAGGPYAPGARVAFEAMERRAARSASMVLVAPNGADVVSYLARAHLAGPRAKMPFVVVDGASLLPHQIGRWRDPLASPLALAERGLLVVEDGARLPRDVQRLLGDALAQRRAPWHEADPIDVVLAWTARTLPGATPDAIDAALKLVLEDALADVIVWPHLRERGEDLRSLVLAGLAREGVSVRGAPLGIEDAAYERLADHPFLGEDAELRVILKRLALSAEGDVVCVADVAGLGLGR